MEKVDYKKEMKELYAPKTMPSLVDVPPMRFAAVDGSGDPDGDGYRDAVSALYSVSYMIKMNGKHMDGYFEYVIPPLEGLWWSDGVFDIDDRDSWKWTAMIRLPEFVTPDVLGWAAGMCASKDPSADFTAVRYVTYTEGPCVQMLHVGPYSQEHVTTSRMNEFIHANGLVSLLSEGRKHHEIYLSDPRKTDPERLRTILRIPVSKKDG